jgi:hypothetical protein
MKTTDEYEWRIQSYIGNKKGLKTIIEPFVDATENAIPRFKKGRV